MREKRSEYFDPLYETISLEDRSLPSRRSGFLVDAKDPLNPRDFVQTAEFARLSFLKQAGLAWLVFPSASHTRFAHSLGCWWLGRIAEALIKIKSGPDKIEPLLMWLHRRKLREEFYLALLFHDIGHGPLSHVLEHNELFVQGLRNLGIVHCDHEERGAALIRGIGPIFEAWSGIAIKRYGTVTKTIKDIRDRMKGLEKRVCLDAVCYLMTGNEEYLKQSNHSYKTDLIVLKELVSGVLDLDRLDHYARDSYFSGLHQVPMNLRGFLSNLKIIWPSNRDEGRPLLSLSAEGAYYAAGLLFNKRLLVSTMFRNADSVAYHCMVNAALTAHLKQFDGNPALLGEKSLEIALMEDEELLETLRNSMDRSAQYLTQRIRSMQPYALVRRMSNSDLRSGMRQIRSKLTKVVESMQDGDDIPKVLIHFDKGFDSGLSDSPPRDWLDASFMVVENEDHPPSPLIEHPEYAADFKHLQDSERVKHAWIFAYDEKSRDAMEQKLQLSKGAGAGRA